jgi:hypothetical protein
MKFETQPNPSSEKKHKNKWIKIRIYANKTGLINLIWKIFYKYESTWLKVYYY